MKRIMYLFLLFLNIIGFAQNDSINSIERFEDKKLLVRGFTGLKNYDFIIKPSTWSTSNRIHYQSIQKAYIGVGVHYDGLGGHLWIGLPFYRDDKVVQQENKAIDIQANFYKKRAIFDVNFQNYSGLYLLNPTEYNLPEDYKEDLFRKDLHLVNLNGNFIYNFNKDFAIGSGFTQTTRQKYTTGSWLFLSSIGWDKFDADSSIIPQKSVLYDKIQQENITHGNFVSLTVGGGYGINVVYKKFFCSMLLTTGPVVQWQQTNVIEEEMKVNLRYNLRGAIGYNGDHWIMGISYVLDNHSYAFSGVNALVFKQHFKVFMGKRFKYNLNPKISRFIYL